MRMTDSDTIAAIATPPGIGAIAIVRMSGPQALAIAEKVVRSRPPKLSQRPDRSIVVGKVIDENGVALDEVLILMMRGPRSYTGEDVVEIHCHGSYRIASVILQRLIQAGARPAGPGEFTRRAFLNGRLDLVQAEAVAALISSQSEMATAVALRQKDGVLSRYLERLYDRLLAAATGVEAWLDFPEEDIPESWWTGVREVLVHSQGACTQLVEGWDRFRVARDGIRVAILGRPNVGKSTLFNMLAGRDRAIVSPHPGTTRDVIEQWIVWKGWTLCFADTAGIRESPCEVEREGVRRSMQEARTADYILYLIECCSAATPEDLCVLQEIGPTRTLIVGSKDDLAVSDQFLRSLPEGFDFCTVSVRREGSEQVVLEKLTQRLISSNLDLGTPALVSERQFDCIREVRELLGRAIQELDSGPEGQFKVAYWIRLAAEKLAELLGKTYTNDLLDRIFATFCIGK